MLMLKPLPIDRSAADAKISVMTFIAHVGFETQELAHVLGSLVRVLRRVEYIHIYMSLDLRIYIYVFIFQYNRVLENQSTENYHTFNTNIQHNNAVWDLHIMSKNMCIHIYIYRFLVC